MEATTANRAELIPLHQPPPPSSSSSSSATPQPPLSTTTATKRPPKRFVKNQIPDTILNNAALNAAIAALPSNYNLEIHKSVHRILSSGAKRVALQFPEGLLMYSLALADIFTSFAEVADCFVLGDVTYGACCVDDLSAAALGADLLIHYGHSCLVPVDETVIPCLYVFVEIAIDVDRLVKTTLINDFGTKNLVLAGTIQFGGAIRAAKVDLEKLGFRVLVPQSKPLSAGEVLGCTAPSISKSSFGDCDWDDVVLIFVADGRFHLEAFMIANPRIRAFRYDPYIGRLFLEEYDHKGMKNSRMTAILKAREAKSWGIVLGTLGRQGNPRILTRLEEKMEEKGLDWTVILMSEMSPARIALFEDSIDAWVQIACPRLSIDWGEAFEKPLLNPFEGEIALGLIPGWWEKRAGGGDGVCAVVECSNGSCGSGMQKSGCCGDEVTEYPMDYYAQDGGEWNSSYLKKQGRPARRNRQATVVADGVVTQTLTT